jgi:putative transcriptional regulator
MESSLAGKLLIAMPNMGDGRFDHAVILLCLHNDEQAMGLIVNKPSEDLKLTDVLKHLGIRASRPLADRKVLFGGPVNRERGYVLHSRDFTVPDATQTVTPDIGLTATRDVLEAMGGDHPPADFVLALGYAGWGPGQLESELAHNAWLVADPDNAIVFDAEFDGKWARAIGQLGIRPAQLMGDAGRA